MNCVQCGSGKLKRASENHRIKVAKILFKGLLTVTLCPSCGESYATATALRDFEHRVARYLATFGPATGETFRFMRKAIGLPAREVAELLSTTPETVSRWETRERDVDKMAWNALGSLVLDELEGRHGVRDRLRALRAKPLARGRRVVELESASAR